MKLLERNSKVRIPKVRSPHPDRQGNESLINVQIHQMNPRSQNGVHQTFDR